MLKKIVILTSLIISTQAFAGWKIQNNKGEVNNYEYGSYAECVEAARQQNIIERIEGFEPYRTFSCCQDSIALTPEGSYDLVPTKPGSGGVKLRVTIQEIDETDDSFHEKGQKLDTIINDFKRSYKEQE